MTVTFPVALNIYCAMDRDYALHVLKLPSSHNMEQLRTNYKRMALLLHPDRGHLDKEKANLMFSLLTDSYKKLKTDLEGGATSRNDADWKCMKTESDRFEDTHRESTSGDDQFGFNIDKFNTKFSNTRLGDENDRGYTSWMGKISPDAAPAIQRQRQEASRRRAAETSSSAIIVDEPEALPASTSIAHSDLGGSRVRDFGKPLDGSRRTILAYTDYKVAHMTASCLIDPETVRARTQFDSLEQFEIARGESANSAMTQHEKAANERHALRTVSKETSRMESLRTRDDLVSRHHANVHALAIK